MSNFDPKIKSEPSKCSYFVPRKKRNCRMSVKPGKKYCGEHAILRIIDSSKKEEDELSEKRITCPNDNKHTCYANRLEKHLKVCPSKPMPLPEYCVKGINSMPLSTYEEIESVLTVHSVDDDYLMRVIKRIDEFYNAQCFEEKINTDILKHDVVEAYIEKNPTFGAPALKHLAQTSSLLANLEKDIAFKVGQGGVILSIFSRGKC